MNKKEILKNCSHVYGNNAYCKFEKSKNPEADLRDEFDFFTFENDETDDSGFRSLADIERIAELEKELSALKRFVNFQGEVVENADTEIAEKDCKIIELEKENAELLSLSAMSDLKKSLAIRDLEQQAKGIATFLLKADASEVVFGSVSDLVIEAHKEIEKLLNKVAKIKVQE